MQLRLESLIFERARPGRTAVRHTVELRIGVDAPSDRDKPERRRESRIEAERIVQSRGALLRCRQAVAPLRVDRAAVFEVADLSGKRDVVGVRSPRNPRWLARARI